MQQSDGASVNVGAVHLSLHSGSHADAPLHFTSDGVVVDQLPLTSFIGPATAIDVGDAAIEPRHAEAAEAIAPRVLFRTSYSRLPAEMRVDDFAAVAPDTIHWLAERDVILVGTDAPSLDPPESMSLRDSIRSAREESPLL